MFVVGFGLLAIIGAAAATGLLVPAERTYTNSIEINAPPEKVWSVLLDKGRMAEWHPYIKKIKVLDDHHWQELSGDQDELPWEYAVVNDSRPSSVELSYGLKDQMSCKWVGQAIATANGTTLNTVNTERVTSSLTRLFMFLMVDRDKYAKGFNNALKARVESLGK
ncbi:MAG: SRPBCC family protein [Acidobacteria bacterium]|nr:SRPBCC family protein [Acidobacteriota bacterium]